MDKTMGRGGGPGGGDRPVVLLVDDVADNLLALEAMLRREDAEILTACSGRAALEILLARDVAVAIIDVMMPEMDGFELAELIRGVERTRRVPIIFVTAGSKADYRVFTGYETGAIDYLFKPLDERVLCAKVDVLVSLAKQQREAERARTETEVLLRFAQAASRSESPAEIYQPALDAASELLGAERSAILLFDESSRMRFESWRGLSDAYRAAVDGHSPWARDDKSAKAIFVADVTEDERMAAYQAIFAAEKVGAIGFVPIASEQLLGKFMLYWEEPRQFSAHDEALALVVASQVAEALGRTRLREAEQRARDRLERLQRVTGILNASVALEDAAKGCLPAICEAIGARAGAVMMLSADEHELEMIGAAGVPEEVADPLNRISVASSVGAAEAIRTRQAVFIESRSEYVVRYPHLATMLEQHIDGTRVVIPLLVGNRAAGTVGFGFSTWRAVPADDRAFLFAVAGQFAQALDRARLFDVERRAREQAEVAEARRAAIQSIADAALAHLEIEPLLTELLARVRRVFGCDTATVLMLDEAGGRLEVRACDGIERDMWKFLAVAYGAGVAGAVVAQGRPMVVDDVAAADIVSPIIKERLRSLMCVPLVLEQRSVGVVHVGFSERRELTAADVELLQTVAARIAVAIDRASAHQALQIAEEKLRVALSAGRMGVWEWSIPTGRVSWTPTLEAIHGLEPGTFPGTFEAYQSDIHPDDKEALLRTVQETLAAGRAHHVEYRIIRPDGQVRWVAGHGNVVSRVDGKPDTMMGVCLDITEGKQAEQALRDSEARYRTLFEVSVYGVITIDEHGIIETANPATERMFGYSAGEMTGRNITLLMPAPYRGEHDSYLQNYLRTGERKIIGIGREVVGRRKDGSTFPMDLAVSEFQVGGKRYFKGLVNDITSRKELEQAREAAVAELQQTLRYNEIFAGVLAHDLRNPLGAMLTATELVIHRHPQQDAILKPLARVISSGERMARMIDQLLDFTTVRVGGGFDLRPRETDLAAICGQVLGELELAHPEWRAKVESLGDFRGTWDPDRLLQAVSNLVTNAGQHGSAGAEILVKIDGTEPESVALEVHNKGAIVESVLPDLFSPFRGTRERRAGSSGLGLGIYITREIIHSHGGEVHVTSSDAAGTAFRVRLPRQPPPRVASSASRATQDEPVG
jgi:PAS domain S-box-containing protein